MQYDVTQGIMWNSSYSIYHCDNAQFYRYYLKVKSDLLTPHFSFCETPSKRYIYIKVKNVISGVYRLPSVPHNMNDCNCVVCFWEELLTC